MVRRAEETPIDRERRRPRRTRTPRRTRSRSIGRRRRRPAHAAQQQQHVILEDLFTTSRQHEAVLTDPPTPCDDRGGCNLSAAAAEVNKVAGNFHVAPGKAFQSAQGQLVHEFKPFDTHTYNISYTIHSRRVDECERRRDGRADNRPDGTSDEGARRRRRPVSLRRGRRRRAPASGPQIHTHQYSVTDQRRGGARLRPPAVDDASGGFIYDISPSSVSRIARASRTSRSRRSPAGSSPSR